MSLRQSFLTKRYSNFFYFDYGIYTYTRRPTCTYTYTYTYAWCIWATVFQSQHEVKTITVTVCQAIQTREEARLRRRRERRAAESSEERETRLAKRRVADIARYAAKVVARWTDAPSSRSNGPRRMRAIYSVTSISPNPKGPAC